MLGHLVEDFKNKAKNISSLQKLLELKSRFLGKKSFISAKFKEILNLEIEEKKKIGSEINQIKLEIEKIFMHYKNLLEKATLKNQKDSEEDFSIPARDYYIGKIHPISHSQELLYEIFTMHGFEVKFGPEIENSWYNFTALNIAEDHPARKMHDTFYIKGEGDKLLRTHTSNVQIRTMEKSSPPFKFISIGKTFRSDSDRTHTPMFHQMEGVFVDKNINFSHLKFLMKDLVEKFFNNADIKIRFRPSYFPFTEPSCEVDIKISEQDPWLEILGCGMIHPLVLKNVNLDPEIYQGFAFGLGVERITMIKHKIQDLREFFSGDLKWIEYFGITPFKTNNVFTAQ
ncbi:MAG: phenylalanine--tRNA ligase subunit alpha [Rickettsia sp.]|nr:phenylalanine--tRNA ligase subunit alpha [Rickettsia sp.]